MSYECLYLLDLIKCLLIWEKKNNSKNSKIKNQKTFSENDIIPLFLKKQEWDVTKIGFP